MPHSESRLRNTVRRLLLVTLGLVPLSPGCTTWRSTAPPLNAIYAQAAQNIGPMRNPVIVIPGILGSNLVERDTRQIVWGAFVRGAADPDHPDGARLVALPMRESIPLGELKDSVEPDGVLESLDAHVGVFRITALEPYRGIIQALAAGRYVDRDIARASAGPVDYAGSHLTCFQFDYDWRRDVSENAARLDALIRDAAELTRLARGTDDPVRVDVVAHSMGGLVLHYYLRYGTRPLPDDGTTLPATWSGAAMVERAIFVGTPNAGSVRALQQLIEGVRYSPIVPEYRAAVIGTMPSIYQLLPRDRHRRVLDAATGAPIDNILDPETWERHGWGLADPGQDRILAWLLPDHLNVESRRRIARDHLRKCLDRAAQFHRALDAPMSGDDAPPSHLTLHLVLGDAEATPSIVAIDAKTRRVTIREWAPGDGTVTRASAMMDERTGGAFRPRLDSPIRWTSVQFVQADHIGLTAHPGFVDALLYELLEAPRTSRAVP